MNIKGSRLAIRSILCMLWSGFFCLLIFMFSPQAEAVYGGNMQAEAFPQVITAQKMAGIARQQLELELYKAGENRRHVLTLTNGPRDLRLPVGKLRYEAALPGQIRYGSVQPVHIRLYIDEKLYRRVICYFRVQVFEKVLVAGMDLPLEKNIAESAVRVEEREVTGGQGRYLTSFQDIEGRVPIRYVHMGQPLEQNMLQNPVVIHSGSPVKLIKKFKGIQVSANGIAMQKGRVGGRIKVRNANSSRILQGKVVDATTVEID
ncbi:MAG: flagellar basal body P-ring formation chaperone FlgA [Selenomonas sp.]|uniref:flagellar basal body P-ring formation chaperone FlgA n=1 Tax=Selenomonas sp. TaxID=2053611 RepID=UPI0025DEFC76|nr:flagellar basal body P-ring formation chaperone FlgA [Selenomonas sp.]MCR5756722.1 flagellar basal body P-ring formation chaperone FlgA [Selenomonas sp.]